MTGTPPGVDGAVVTRSAPPDSTAGAGSRIVVADYAGTGVFAATALAAAAFPHDLAIVAAVVDLILFGAGCAAFLWAYAVAVSRSRTHVVHLAGLFFLSGTAPKPVAIRLRGTFFAQVGLAVLTASLRPFTPLAFGVLVPVYGLGLMGLWGARHGVFVARDGEPSPD
jgi:hypothetical protein